MTLGIYSAWAKVRKKRYFYGNTFLKNDSFEYVADPKKILKGRLIVFGVFVLYMITTNFYPVVVLLIVLVSIVLFPWLAVKALTFKSRNSSYRNIRFDFKARYGEALAVFIGQPIVTALTFGLAYPYQPYKRNKFVVEKRSYGTTPFMFSGQVGSFYSVYLKAVGIVILSIVPVIIIFILVPELDYLLNRIWEITGMSLMDMLLALVYIFPAIYVRTTVKNLVLSNIRLGNNRLKSTLQTSKMFWLYLSNAVAIVISLGLLIPWASIRMVRYRLENLRLLAVDDLDVFIAGEQEKVGAASEEIGEFFDFDIGL